MDKKFTALQIPEGNQCPTDKVEQPCTIGDLSLPDGCECTFTGLGRNALANYLQLYNVFMLFWGLCFCSALGEMVLAGAFSSWYWTLKKSDVPALPVLTSIGRTIRYHTGTLAFGSLIIAIIKMIRLMLQYIQDKLEEKGADNPVVKAILCICKCCFWCLEKFMKFINRSFFLNERLLVHQIFQECLHFDRLSRNQFLSVRKAGFRLDIQKYGTGGSS